jgi:hypothetical protein
MKDLIFLLTFFLATWANTEFIYQDVGTGHCADSLSAQKLPFFRIGGSIGEAACVARCDGDNACLGYTYDQTDCFNFYGTSRLTVTWDAAWEEGPTTQFESGTIDGLWTGFGDSSAMCKKKLDYLNVGQGSCADENGNFLNWARATHDEENCRSLCDLDDACLAYRHVNNDLCYNFFGSVHLNVSSWTTVDTSYTQNPTRVTSFGNTGFCIAKNLYELVGGGACADANGDLKPVARIGNGIGNKACRERCDVDPACIGFRYVQHLCYNVFGAEAMTVYNDWDAIDEPSTSAEGIAQAKGNVGICMRKSAFPTPAPTYSPTKFPTDIPTEAPTHSPTFSPTQVPTVAPTDTPTQVPTDAPTESSCQSSGQGSEFKFTWKRRCVNGWSSTCADGLVFFDTNGQEINLASFNPTITDTGFWRSGAHSYIGAEILKDVGLSYCSEPLRCSQDVAMDDEVVHIVLDREIEFSSFDLQQVDKLFYQGDWTFEVKSGDNWEMLVQNDVDFTHREIRKFGYECDTCGSLTTASKIRFVFQPECRNGFSAVCVNGLAFRDTQGAEIDLSAYNPTITDTGFWRSADNYIGAWILKGDQPYCSENRACTGVPEEETVTLTLDRDWTFSSFDLAYTDQPQYRAKSFKLEVLRGSHWMPVLQAVFDLENNEIRNFGNKCECSINGFWNPESYDYVQGVTEGVISDFPSHGPGTGRMNQDGTVYWIWHNNNHEHRGTFSDDCSTLTWENNARWFRSTYGAVRFQIEANGWTEADFLANQDEFATHLATELGLAESEIVVSLQSIGWLRRLLSEALVIDVYVSVAESKMKSMANALSQPSLLESLDAKFEISFEMGAIEFVMPKEASDSIESETTESEESEFPRGLFVLLCLVSLIVGVGIGVACTCAFSKSESTKSTAGTVDIEEANMKRKPATKSEITLELYGEESNMVKQEGRTTH